MIDTKMTAKLACCLVLALGSSALATQQTSPSAAKERGDLDEIRRISTLIGAHVMNSTNTQIAKLRDLVLSPEGEMLYAVLSCGGVAGVGETYTAAPFDCLKVRHDNGKWTVSLDRTTEDIKKAPTIQSENYRELTDATWVARVNQYFHPRREAKAQTEPQTGGVQQPGTVKWVLLASKVRSANLKNNQNEDLGKVEDLLLDRNDRVVFAIIGQGGVLGVGENHIPVPWAKVGLNLNRETDAVTVTIDAAKAHLEKAPLVKGDNYATMLAPGFADEVRHYFGMPRRGAAIGGEKERP